MAKISHPSLFVDINLLQLISGYASVADLERKLHPEQCRVLYEQKWLKMYLPMEYDGLNYSLGEGLRMLEALAWADGSTGWVATLCSGANWFMGFINPLLHPIFRDEQICIAGSGQSTGTAELKEKGYEVSGHWKYATGSAIASHFTANCMMTENGHLVKDKNGLPLIKSFLFKKDEVQVVPTWKSIGMVATGSNSFSVENITIPLERSFEIHEKSGTLNDHIFRYPFQQFAETTLAINISGMAIRFFDLYEQHRFVQLKKNPSTAYQRSYEKANLLQQEFLSQRDSFYEAVANSWLLLKAYQITERELKRISVKSQKLARMALQLTDAIYPYCGMVATDPSTEINRVWRNLHTASQHSLLAFS